MNISLTNKRYFYLLELFRVIEVDLKLSSDSLPGEIGIVWLLDDNLESF